jgi:hypothetical protein
MIDAKKKVAIAMVMLAASGLGIRPAAAQVEPGKLARDTAKDYREAARYPASSHALKKGEADPIQEKRIPTRQTRRGPDDAEPAISVWAAKVSFEKGQPVDLYATLETKGKAVRNPAEITGEIVGSTGGITALVAYRDDGQGPDRKAGDGIYSARWTPTGIEDAPAASYMVRVRARLANGDLREAAGGFLYSDPAAHLTGHYRDFLRDGNLVIAAEVDVAESGRFHLAGTLYTLAGEPIGFAQAAANLEPGRHWIELSYYGLIFHDRQAAGPYRVGTLALSTTTHMPNALNDVVADAYVTHPYRVEQMRSASFERPQLIESARRLDLDAERAEREARGIPQQ